MKWSWCSGGGGGVVVVVTAVIRVATLNAVVVLYPSIYFLGPLVVLVVMMGL